jgi:hypothetical protein
MERKFVRRRVAAGAFASLHTHRYIGIEEDFILGWVVDYLDSSKVWREGRGR